MFVDFTLPALTSSNMTPQDVRRVAERISLTVYGQQDDDPLNPVIQYSGDGQVMFPRCDNLWLCPPKTFCSEDDDLWRLTSRTMPNDKLALIVQVLQNFMEF